MKRMAVLLAIAIFTMAIAVTANALTFTTANDGVSWHTINDSGFNDSESTSGASLFTSTFEMSGRPALDFPYKLRWSLDGGGVETTGLTRRNGNATANLKAYYGAALMDTATLLANASLTSPGHIGKNGTRTSFENPFSHKELFNFNNIDCVATQTTDSQHVAPVPEPGTMALLGIGLFGLAVYGKRRQNNSNAEAC